MKITKNMKINSRKLKILWGLIICQKVWFNLLLFKFLYLMLWIDVKNQASKLKTKK